MRPRKESREKIKKIIETLDVLDDIKDELFKNHSNIDFIYQIDDIIRHNEYDLMKITENMYENDVCSCGNDGKTMCSSELCPSKYSDWYEVVERSDEK